MLGPLFGEASVCTCQDELDLMGWPRDTVADGIPKMNELLGESIFLGSLGNVLYCVFCIKGGPWWGQEVGSSSQLAGPVQKRSRTK